MIAHVLMTISRPFLDRRLGKTILGMTLLSILCLAVAHGCHTGGHDLDLEP